MKDPPLTPESDGTPFVPEHRWVPDSFWAATPISAFLGGILVVYSDLILGGTAPDWQVAAFIIAIAIFCVMGAQNIFRRRQDGIHVWRDSRFPLGRLEPRHWRCIRYVHLPMFLRVIFFLAGTVVGIATVPYEEVAIYLGGACSYPCL